jgi:Concanavalin A-like lectin/glucanases superfamily
MSNFSQYDGLVSRYVDGLLNPDELAELERMLLADDQFAEHFARWCLTHRQIAELLTESALHHLMDQFVQGSPGVPRHSLSHLATVGNRNRPNESRDNTAVSEPGRPVRSWLSRAGGPRWFVLAAAAAVIGAAAWFIVERQSPPAENGSSANIANNGQTRDSAEQKPQILATLTQLADPVWQPGAPVLHYGQQLYKGGQIALRSGMAKVTYDCGAEVVLEGPCDFWLQDAIIGYLASGKITANVPRRAFSFAILSPKVDFVDLGTSFGVTVSSTGQTELHVFEGEVLCSQTKQQQADEPNDMIHVTASKAMEFAASGGEPSSISMNEHQFSKLISLRRAAHMQAQGLVSSRLALWLAADVAVTTDHEHRVISWQDILYGDNRSAEDAIQEQEAARPALVDDAFNGHPGIRFNGTSNYLLTTPLETTDDQTVLFVCQFSQSAYDKDRIWGGQILNYDGPPSRYLSNTLEPGVLQIGEPLLAKEFKPTLLTGQVFAGFIGSATVEAGRVDAKQVGANVPVVAAYRYDYEHGKAELMINGRSYGEARAFAPQGITSRKIIGRHAWKQLFFHGDLAELLIYNKALSAQELAEATSYLADKYSIKLGPTAGTEKEVTK